MPFEHPGNRKKLRRLFAGGLLAVGALTANPQSAYPVTGGNDVTDSSMGYVAQVSHVLGGFCSGTLISQQWVLTAAHCVGGVTDPREMTVRVGTNVRMGGQVRRAAALYSFPGYMGAHNDVALLKLEFPVYGIQPIPLAWNAQSFRWDGYSGGPFTKYDDGVIAGWGTSSTSGKWPNNLQFKGVSIYPTQLDSGGWRTIPVSAGPCPGDSGGPLMVSINGQLYQVGVTKGADCTTSGNYSEVGQGILRTWIIDTMQNSP